jgi:hypothetical protein
MRLRCVRRKRVFALLVCQFSHLKISIPIEKVHSCFKSQSELRILPVGSVNGKESFFVFYHSVVENKINIKRSLKKQKEGGKKRKKKISE